MPIGSEADAVSSTSTSTSTSKSKSKSKSGSTGCTRGYRWDNFLSLPFLFTPTVGAVYFFKTGNQMTDAEFISWATDKGIDADSVAVILECAAMPLKAKTVRTDCIYAPDDICDLFDRDGLKVSPQNAGFVFIGYCANGDPIALDVTHRPGSIWYINHESMHSTPLREVAVCVANDLRSAYGSIVNVRDFPLNYGSAIRKQNT